jgi:hypothetical protein
MTIGSKKGEYHDEISAWLIGRLSPNHSRINLTSSFEQKFDKDAPALAWWLFEGKKYPNLSGSMKDNFERINRWVHIFFKLPHQVETLATLPVGEIDWLATSTMAQIESQKRYRTKLGGSTPSRDELRCIIAWSGWINKLWNNYCHLLKLPYQRDPICNLPTNLPINSDIKSNILKMAAIASRSRWPIFRNVITPSFKVLLGEDRLNSVPLPNNYDTLFELLTLVRVLKALYRNPKYIQWLDNFSSSNQGSIPGIKFYFQPTLDVRSGMAEGDFPAGLSTALRQQCAIGLPRRLDAAILFDESINGYDGIIIEAKSGERKFRSCIFQLASYRSAIRSIRSGKFVLLGITEYSKDPFLIDELVDHIKNAPSTEDLWLFLPAESIDTVMNLVFKPLDHT